MPLAEQVLSEQLCFQELSDRRQACPCSDRGMENQTRQRAAAPAPVLGGPQWSAASVGHAGEDGERDAVVVWCELCGCVVTDSRAVSLNSDLLNKLASIP